MSRNKGGVPKGNGKRLAPPQSLNGAVKGICDVMRRSNCAGALQYVPELTWILFLRILDESEAHESETAEHVSAPFAPTLEAPYRWRDWAAPDGPKRKALADGTLGDFRGFVAFAWSQIAGPVVTLTSTKVARPTFSAPEADADG